MQCLYVMVYTSHVVCNVVSGLRCLTVCIYAPYTSLRNRILLHISLSHNLPYIVLDQPHPPSRITHLSQFNITPARNSVSIPVDNESSNKATTNNQQSKDPHVTYIGAALPSISTKLL